MKSLEKSEDKRQKGVAADGIGEGHNDREIGDHVAPWCVASEVDHPDSDRDHDDIHVPEITDHSVETDLEAGLLEFLGRGGPLDVDAEEMAAEGLADVERKTAEEENEKGHPFGAGTEGFDVGRLAHAVAQHGESDRGEDRVDAAETDEDVP